MPEAPQVMSPLSDVRVLGVTVYLAGPFTLMNLARLGADAIKVERPGYGDPTRLNGPFATPSGYSNTQDDPSHLSTRFLKRSQGLKSITLNLKNEKGRKIFLDLAAKSDVVVENLSPGAMTRLGLAYDDIKSINPAIIYASISGYGQTGNHSGRKAHDPQIQGMSGLMDINGDEKGPPTRVGFYIGDLVTPLFACYSILAALRERDKTGLGQYLDVSMMDSLTSLMFMENLEEALLNGDPIRQGNNSRSGPMGLYHTKDGDITITVASDEQWERLSKALDAPYMLSEPKFKSFLDRAENVVDARKVVQRLLDAYTRDDAIKMLEAHNVPCGLVRTVNEVMDDEHFWNRGSLQEMRSAAFEFPVPGIAAGFPVQFSGGVLPKSSGAPLLGMHNSEIYSKILSLSEIELEVLESEGII